MYRDSSSCSIPFFKCTLQFGDAPDPDVPIPYHNAYTLLNIIFYVLTPIPLLVASKVSDEGGLPVDLAGTALMFKTLLMEFHSVFDYRPCCFQLCFTYRTGQ